MLMKLTEGRVRNVRIHSQKGQMQADQINATAFSEIILTAYEFSIFSPVDVVKISSGLKPIHHNQTNLAFPTL